MKIVFQGCTPLIIKINDTPLAHRWQQLVAENVIRCPQAVFRDQQKYTPGLLHELAKQAKQVLGWDWDTSDLSLANTTKMHKDIETYLAQGYENIPEAHDELLHEIHFCLHAVESGSQRNSWLQLEWYNDDGFEIDSQDYPGKLQTQFGDIRLQNPYVGHHPLYLYQQRDSTNVMQTCRLHDRARPGICIVIADPHGTPAMDFDWDHYEHWFRQHGKEFVDLHGWDRIRQFTGHPVVGRVENIEDLYEIISRPYLEFERIELD